MDECELLKSSLTKMTEKNAMLQKRLISLKSAFDDQTIRIRQLETQSPKANPMRAGTANIGTQRYNTFFNLLTFIAENINFESTMEMILTGQVILHETQIALGRIRRYTLDRQMLDHTYLSVPEEDVERFMAILKPLVNQQEHLEPSVVGTVATDWQVIPDTPEQGTRPTIYVLNSSARRVIILGDWPQSKFDTCFNSPLDLRTMFSSCRRPDRREFDLSDFLNFVASNIVFEDEVIFEPCGGILIIHDRIPRTVAVQKLCRFKLTGGDFEGLFLCIPEQERDCMMEIIKLLVCTPSLVFNVAREMAKTWRVIVNTTHENTFTYAWNEDSSSLLIVSRWPDDSLFGRVYTPRKSLRELHFSSNKRACAVNCIPESAREQHKSFVNRPLEYNSSNSCLDRNTLLLNTKDQTK